MLSTISGMPARGARWPQWPPGRRHCRQDCPPSRRTAPGCSRRSSFSRSAALVGLGKAGLHAELGQDVGKQRVRRAVELRYRDDVAAGLGNVEHRVVECGLPGGDRQGIDAAFELRHAPLEHLVGRIADAGVAIALDLQVKQRRTVRGTVEGIGDGLVDRHRHRLGGRVRVKAGMQGDCFGFHRHASRPVPSARRPKSTIVICSIAVDGTLSGALTHLFTRPNDGSASGRKQAIASQSLGARAGAHRAHREAPRTHAALPLDRGAGRRFESAPALSSTEARLKLSGARRGARTATPAGAWARALHAGDVVCLLMENCPQYLAIWLGLTRIGVTVALINTNLTGELLLALDQCGAPRVVIASARLAPALVRRARAASRGRVRCWVHGAGDGRTAASGPGHGSRCLRAMR